MGWPSEGKKKKSIMDLLVVSLTSKILHVDVGDGGAEVDLGALWEDKGLDRDGRHYGNSVLAELGGFFSLSLSMGSR